MLCCDSIIYDYIWKCIIFLIAYGEMHDFLASKKLASLIKFLRVDFMDIVYYLKDLKMLYLDLWCLGKLIKNLLDKKWVLRLWEPCEYFGYFKGFYETTWNWTIFWFHVNCELFMFLPLGYGMWLPGDYPARCYSLWHCYLNTCLCDGYEFQLCVGRLVSALCRQWVSTLCWQISFGFVLAMSFSFVSAD